MMTTYPHYTENLRSRDKSFRANTIPHPSWLKIPLNKLFELIKTTIECGRANDSHPELKTRTSGTQHHIVPSNGASDGQQPTKADPTPRSTYESKKSYLQKLITTVPPSGRILMVGSEQCLILRELYDEGRVRPDVFFHCIDGDEDAIDEAILWLGGRTNRCIIQKVDLHRFWTSEYYDLIWSDGIFDGLEEDSAKRLVQRLHGFLAPQGQMVLGSFADQAHSSDLTEINTSIESAQKLQNLREAVFDGTTRSIDCSLLNVGPKNALFMAFNILTSDP